MNNLFQSGSFTLHSGSISDFKIECDNLLPTDFIALANRVGKKFTFGSVEGVPTGGLEFAEYCKAHINPSSDILLIVDDVLTTGASIEELRKRYGYGDGNYGGPIIGVVIFARGKCPDWVTPIFQMWEE